MTTLPFIFLSCTVRYHDGEHDIRAMRPPSLWKYTRNAAVIYGMARRIRCNGSDNRGAICVGRNSKHWVVMVGD
jgi:hypothetical protein